MLRALRSRSWYGTTPATCASPEVGVRMPVSILMVVDLPAPFGPSRASSSPGATSKVTSETASFATRSGLIRDLIAPDNPGRRMVV